MNAASLVAYSFITRNYMPQVRANWIANDGSYREEEGIGWVPSEKVRLFPNKSFIRFENPVHEFVEASLAQNGVEIRKSSIPIHHYGKLNTEKTAQKTERYYGLEKEKRAEKGEKDTQVLYELAVQAAELKRYEEALGYWNELLEINPTSPSVYHGIGNAYFNINQYEDAIASYKKALELNPDSRDSVIMRSLCEICTGNAKVALSFLDDLLKKDPRHPISLLTQTVAYFCSGRKRDGLEYSKKLEEQHIGSKYYFTDLARRLIANQQFQYASFLLDAAQETGNVTEETPALLEECERKMKDSRIQGVKDSSENHKKQDSRGQGFEGSSEDKRIFESDATFMSFPLVGNLSEREGFRPLQNDAGQASRNAKHSDPRLLGSLDPARIAYLFITRNYVIPTNIAGWIANDGRHSNEEAGSGWFPGEKVRLFPNDKRIRFENPVHERVEQSLESLGIAIEQCPIPIHHYGMIDEGKIRAKSEYYYDLGKKRLAEKGGEDFRAMYDLGVQASGIGRYQEAIEYLNKVIAFNPDFSKAYESLGNAYFNLGQYENALSSYMKSLKLNPSSRDAMVMSAQCEIILGESGQAIQNLESLLKKAPSYEKALLLIAAAHFAIGEREKGMEYVKELRDITSGFIGYFKDFAQLLSAQKRTREAQLLLDAAEDIKNRLD